ncbi:MAG: aminotransferase, partial [Planctomycetota bacterium]
ALAAPESMIGGLASALLPPSAEPVVPPFGLDPLQVRLYEQWRIEVPVIRWSQPALRMVRVSPQAYHSEAQHAYLATALRSGC